MQPFAAESRSFRQNGKKLTGNMKNGQFPNVVTKYSLFGSW